jgi:hypothetical protein
MSNPKFPNSAAMGSGNANNNLLLKARMGNQIKFDDELKGFFFGFANDSFPTKESLELLNDMTIDFISKLTSEAFLVSKQMNIPFDYESVLFTIRRDLKKHERCLEILNSFQEIKKLRNQLSRDLTQNVKRQDRSAASAVPSGDSTPDKAKGANGLPKNKPGRKRANPSEEDRSKPPQAKKKRISQIAATTVGGSGDRAHVSTNQSSLQASSSSSHTYSSSPAPTNNNNISTTTNITPSSAVALANSTIGTSTSTVVASPPSMPVKRDPSPPSQSEQSPPPSEPAQTEFML